MRGVATAVVAAIIIGTLYFGREVFVPIALAILLSFVLAPLVRLLQRWRLPRGLSVVGVVLLAFVSIFALGGVIATQVTELAGDLPRYQFTMREKIKSLRGTAAPSGTLERAADVLNLGKELNKPKEPAAGPPASLQTPAPAPEARPIPVEVRQPPPTAREHRGADFASAPPSHDDRHHRDFRDLHPPAARRLAEPFHQARRLARSAKDDRRARRRGDAAEPAVPDPARRERRDRRRDRRGLVDHRGSQPDPMGNSRRLLRFVPYIGAVIAAVFPLTLAAAVDPGWSMLLWTAALFLVVEPVVGHVIEPLLYGHSTGLSPVAVVTSATFWTALWGPVGLVLATPLTVCLVVLGRRRASRVPGRDVRRSTGALAAGDILSADAGRRPGRGSGQGRGISQGAAALDLLRRRGPAGLKLAQSDVTRGALDREQAEKIKAAVLEVVDDLAEQADGKQPDATA